MSGWLDCSISPLFVLFYEGIGGVADVRHAVVAVIAAYLLLRILEKEPDAVEIEADDATVLDKTMLV